MFVLNQISLCPECFLQVGTNGYFTFSNFSGFTPFPFSKGNGISIVAPFFTDIDVSSGHGSIRYQVHDEFTNSVSLKIAKKVDILLNETKFINFRVKWLLIAEWNNVTPYGKHDTVSFPLQYYFTIMC